MIECVVMFILLLQLSSILNQMITTLYINSHEQNLFFPETVNELDQHVGSHCQSAIMHKWFGLELNVVKASSNARVECGHSWIHFPADPFVLCLVSCLSAFVYSSSSFRLSTFLTQPMALQSNCLHTPQACSRLASPL